MAYECALCGTKLGENPLTYWCSKCYADWRKDIINRKEWTLYLQRLESRRRYGETTMRELGIKLIHLNGKFDIAVVNGKTKLVPTNEYYNEVD